MAIGNSLAILYATYQCCLLLRALYTQERFSDFRLGRGQWEGHYFQMGCHKMARFNYQCKPGHRINFQLVLNAAYSCASSIDCMHWSLKTKYLTVAWKYCNKICYCSHIQYHHQKMQDCVL